MLTRQRALYLVLGCTAIVATAVYFSNPLQAENRPLTDQEMASIFGRQGGPPPGVPCDGCYLKVVAIACAGIDNCFCVQDEVDCAEDSREYGQFQAIERFREIKQGEQPNNDYEFIDKKTCYTRYHCIKGETILKASCDWIFTGDCYLDTYSIGFCTDCTPGNEIQQHKEDWHRCIPCNEPPPPPPK